VPSCTVSSPNLHPLLPAICPRVPSSTLFTDKFLISFATWSLKVAFCFLSVVVLLFVASSSSAANKLTALDAYVHAPDSNYRYELIQQTKHAGYTLYLLQMTPELCTPSLLSGYKLNRFGWLEKRGKSSWESIC
jgi:hypothetical protein